MKKFATIIVICILGYMGYQAMSSDSPVFFTSDGDTITIESGDNTFIAQVVSDYHKDLRIFGINVNNSDGWSPFAYADYIFVASPYIGDTEECEANTAHAAPLINIIVGDEEIVNIISDLEKTGGRRRATIIGEKILIKNFTYQGDDHSDALKKQGKLNPRSAIWIKEIIL